MSFRSTLRPGLTLAVFMTALVAWSQEGRRLPQPDVMTVPVVATVGPITIMGKELRAEVNRLIPLTFYHSKIPAGRLLEMQRQACSNLVERALIFLDAQKRGLEVDEKELRAEFERTLAKAGPQYANISKQRMADLLEDYKPLVRRRLMLNMNEARFEGSLGKIDDKALREHHEKRKAEFRTTSEVHTLHILMKIAPSASKKEADVIRVAMDALVAQLEAGASFDELARTNSDDIYSEIGGDMGFVTRASFNEGVVGDAVFALKDGETSDVIQSLYGLHLLKRLETKPGRELTFDEARESLYTLVQTERRDVARATWLGELRERYPVEIDERLVELAQAESAESSDG